MNFRSCLSFLFAAGLTVWLAACASMPAPVIQHAGAYPHASRAGSGDTTTRGPVSQQPLEAEAPGRAQPVIRRGTGEVINRDVAAAPPPNLGGSSGSATFNFEGESLQAVVKAILGDMLGQNFTIAPGVQGTVTLNVQKVTPAQAFTLLENQLALNNARMVYSNGIYNILPADQALAGNVAPRTGAPVTARGFESRVVPLRYISAAEMEKILKPYARPNAIVNVDSGRNVITVAGTAAELENYLRTIAVFDVDWMSSMSVGVFPLQSGKATDVVQDLERVFGEQSKSPVAGMFRFMPLEAANAVLVISSQPAYLDDIQQWLERIDSASGGVQLFSYELKYIKAKDLADRLADVFGGGGGRSEGGGTPSLMPGLQSTEIRDSGVDDSGNSSAGIGSTGTDTGTTGDTGDSGGGGQLSLGPSGGGNGSVTLQVDGDRVGVSAVDETNTLLVRTTPQAWRSIRDVIERLDVMPLQVHIEAQVVEVNLTGDLKYGVNWYFENALNGALNVPLAAGARELTGANGLAWSFPGNGSLAVINALDQVTDVQLLQTPSVMVRNNAEATLNVGTRIPIASVSFNPNGNTGNDGTFSQVQYLDTGVILKVRPRVTKDGVVFLDIVQEVSSPGAPPQNCGNNCNVPINTRKLKTQAAIQSGDTVMLAGLISDGVTRGSSGIPGLSRIPVIGALFGNQSSRSNRNEVIVLLTPTIVRNPQEAADLTDEYGRRFRALEPLHRTPKQR